MLAWHIANAQKPFVEGKIMYKVKLETADHKTYDGTYSFCFKGAQIRKELNLNVYQEILIINTANNTAYSLKNMHDKKYAIQLDMNEMQKEQLKYAGYDFKEVSGATKTIAGFTASKGQITYTDGTKINVYYTNTWFPQATITFERFPDAKFLPLSFYYADPNGVILKFDADEVTPGLIENSIFAIPHDYKVVSYDEYKKIK